MTLNRADSVDSEHDSGPWTDGC